MSGEQGRAIGYIRVSTLRQVEEGNSLASQSETIRSYAKSRGLKMMSRDIVIDDGVSGGIPIWERKGGKRLLKMLESGKYDHVIVTKLDRMFRITSDAILTIDELREMGIGYHIINMGGQSLDTTSSMGRFILIFIASVSELERSQISERTREAIQYLRRNGRKFTRAIYGWDATPKGRMVPNWEEQGRIDFMRWQMIVNDVSATKVAHMMNKRGWPGKLGGVWHAETVIRVTKNKYHIRRRKFRYPHWWNSQSWHGKLRDNEQRDELVVVGKVGEVWDKDDLKPL